MAKPQSILITGGAGFVGSNLARTLQAQHPKASITIVDDFRTGTFANLCLEGEDGWSFRGHVIARSLHDQDMDLQGLLEELRPDVIFHEASITDTTVDDQAAMIAQNVEPFELLVELAGQRGIKLVWASSAATYGTAANGATADRRPFQLADAGRPANVYGFSKWIMENLHRRALERYPKLHLVGLRYFNVFGPGEQHKSHMASMIHQLAHQMLGGRRPRIFTDGEQARDHVYVNDVVGCTLAAMDDDAEPGIYNVGTGEATSFNRIVAALNEALSTHLSPDYIDNPYRFYQDYTCADLSRTTAGLGWTPAHTTDQGIAEYAAGLKAARV